jgi:hypothetical protein
MQMEPALVPAGARVAAEIAEPQADPSEIGAAFAARSRRQSRFA